MVHFPFSVVVAPAGQGYGHSPWRTTCLSPFSSCVALWIWQQSQSMHSECQPPLTRVRCFRRAATPPHGLSEIPQGKSCAFRDKAYMRDGHLALLPASTTLRGWRSALQHPWPAPLPRRPRQVVGDGARPCTSKQAATRCVRYSTRGNGSYGYKINDNGRSALTTSLLLAAIEMEPAKRSGWGYANVTRNFQPTVRHADADLGAKVVTQLTRET
jgi:hypothetical protein